MIGKLKHIPLREVWKHEAHDFTVWLEENIETLNEVLDLNLSNAEREQAAGAFSVDLVAEDENGNPVVIENQLEKSNHDHLGKLLTYVSSIGAKIGIWIVAEPRPEHVTAISWLNESNAAAFYLLKLQAIQIGDSEQAPLLTLIVGPSLEGLQVGKKKKEISERHHLRRKFWTQLLEHAKTQTRLHAAISPCDQNWVGAGAGLSGLAYNYTITQHGAMIELYIDRGKGAESENKQIFDHFYAAKTEVEGAFDGQLEWQSLDGKRACRICKRLEAGGYRSEEEDWPKLFDEMVTTMINLEKGLSPFVRTLKKIEFGE